MMNYSVALGIFACLVGGCESGPRNDDGPEPSALTSAPATATPPHNAQPAPTYSMPPNLCNAIAWNAFADADPGQPVRQTAELGRKDDPARASTATCTAFTGQAADGLLLTIEARIYVQAVLAHNDFETWKSLDIRRLSDIKGVDGIGSAAYSMSDRILGPALIVVHGNALFRFSIRDLGTANHIPLGDPILRLRKLATATITGMPQTPPPTAATRPPVGPHP